MATLLRVDNFPQTNIKEQSQLAQDVASGANSIVVQSGNGYMNNDIVFLGVAGTETMERLVIQSVSAQTITFTSNLKFNHLQYEPVISVKGDTIQLYTSPNINNALPDDSTFTPLNTPVSLALDQTYTEINDPLGGAGTWYKYTFINATSSYESSLADSIASRGGGYGHYCSIDDVRSEAGMTKNRNITDADIDKQRNHAESRINSELFEVYNLPFAQPVPWLVNYIATKLAAGYLLAAEYGTMATGSTKDSKGKIDEGETLLMSIKDRSSVLTDVSGKSLLISQAVSGYPNSTSDPCDAPRAFTRSKVF